MAAEGIGARVLRKEDKRFITGKGKYTDDFTMPRANDLPSFDLSTHETLCPNNPLGMKGCGEAGAIGSPPAVINAITDAIGNNNLSMPVTPSRVWAALNA